MSKNPDNLSRRKRFIKKLIDKPEAVCAELEMLQISLKNSRTTDERFRIASELLFLSEKTIFRDYIN